MAINWANLRPSEGWWGWVVVLGAFLIHVICDGIVYAFGLFVQEFRDSFGESASLTSWIVSVMVGFMLGAGPIAGALANHFGCRAVSILGSCIAALGSVASYFATSVMYLIVSVGVLMGFGFGLMFCPAVIIVNMYFTKRRSLAVGIVVCGAGVGTFIFAPLSAYFIEEYAWQGTFLIYAGIILNGCVLGALFRYPESMEKERRRKSRSAQTEEPTEQPNGYFRQASVEKPLYAHQLSNGSVFLAPPKQYSLSETMLNSTKLRASSATRSPAPNRKRCVSLMTIQESMKNQGHALVVHRHRGARPLERKDIFYSGSLVAVAESGEPEKKSFEPILEEPEEEFDKFAEFPAAGSITEIAEDLESATGEDSTFFRDICGAFKQMTDVSLLRDPIFVLIAISNFLTNVGYDLPRIFLPDYAFEEHKILPAESSWLLSIWGIANTAGRVGVGILSDTKWASKKRLWIYCLSLMFAGLVNLFGPVYTDYGSLTVYAALFGLSLSTYISLTSVVLVDLLGLDRLTNAFGLLLFFQGVGAIVGPPIGGWIVDITGSYVQSFVFAGVALFLSGAILCPIPLLLRIQNRKQSQSQLQPKA